MTDLTTLANLAEIFGAATVITGVIIGVVQIHHYRRQRAELAAIELVRSFQNPEFIHAMRIILDLPAECTGPNLKERGSECEDAAMTVSITVEAIALFAFGISWAVKGRIFAAVREDQAPRAVPAA